MQNLTEKLRTARGLVASLDPTAGPERIQAFLNELTALFTEGTGPLRPAEVAAMFNVDPRTVNRWGDQGKVKMTRTPGGHRRFDRADVEALLAGEQA